MMAALVEAGVLRSGVLLGSLTTYKLGGPAKWFAQPADEVELMAVLEVARDIDVPIVTLGRGSNVVISDAGLDAVVIQLGSGFGTATINADGIVAAGAAMPLPRVARYAAEHDRGGLEFMVGIPGSVGGAVRMNAGCFGSETAQWLIDATIISTTTAERRVATPQDLEMQYRTTNLGTDEIVSSARFATIARPQAESLAEMRTITAWRRDHQPGGTFNAGSAFKNPPGDAAGRIIDSLGLKGFRVGGAAVSFKHANFFEADADATPQDVYALVHRVKEKVLSATGIELTPEIVFLGVFEPVSGSQPEERP